MLSIDFAFPAIFNVWMVILHFIFSLVLGTYCWVILPFNNKVPLYLTHFVQEVCSGPYKYSISNNSMNKIPIFHGKNPT